MRNRIFVILAAAAVVACWGTALFFYREAPGGSAWKGYQILYVSKDFPEEEVLALCGEAGIEGVIALSLQKPPLASDFLPVSMSIASYGERREAYFFDKDRQYKLYYIENAYAGRLPSLCRKIAGAGAGESGVNVPPGKSWVPGLAGAAVFALFLGFSRKRDVAALGGIFPVILAFRLGSYTAGGAAVLALYSLFLLQRAWGARGFLRLWLRKLPGPIALAASALLAASGGPAQGGLFALTLAASASALFALDAILALLDSRRSFSPVKILPPGLIPVVTRGAALLFLAPAAVSAAFLAITVFSGNIALSSGASIQAPMPVEFARKGGFGLESYEEIASTLGFAGPDSLPSLAELAALAWEALRFPNTPLSFGEKASGPGALSPRGPVPGGEKISVPEYGQGPAGIIEKPGTEYVFDESFISGIIFAINSEVPPALEKVLISEERFALCDFRAGGKREGVIPVIFLLVSAFIPIAVAAICIKGKKLDDWSN